MMQNPTINNAQRRKGRRDLLILMVIFFAPIIIAIYLYNNLDKWQITAGKNNGDLIQPPRLLPDESLLTLDGTPYRFSDMRGHWILVQVGKAECDRSCEQNLYYMRQTRLGQGNELHRIMRLYISTDGSPAASLLTLLEQHKGLQVVHGSQAAIDKILPLFRHDVGQGEQLQALYIVDPRGYVMMSYPQGFEPKGLIKDLSHLLKYAQAG